MLNRLCRTFAFVSMLISPIAYTADWHAETKDKHLVVMELFTAEGCGLCPAAERWVKQLPQKGVTGEDVVILNFHVDYLDQKKGWIDKFASPVFTERQKQLARLNLFQTVYTPEFFISGEVLHDWQAHGIDAIDFVSEFKPEAQVSLQAKQDKNSLTTRVQLSVEGDENKQHSQFFLALTENNVTSQVRGGDNAGATFHHQNLVRKWLGPFSINADGKADLVKEIALDESWKLTDMSLIAIVQNMENGYVLQGLALPLKD